MSTFDPKRKKDFRGDDHREDHSGNPSNREDSRSFDHDDNSSPFAKDKRPRISRSPRNDRPDNWHREDNGEKRRSFNPNFTKDNRKRDESFRDKTHNRDNERPQREERSWNRDDRDNDRPQRSWNRSDSPQGPRKPWNRDERNDERPQREERSWNRSDKPQGPRKPWNRDDRNDERPQREERSWNRDERPQNSWNRSDKPQGPRKPWNRDERTENDRPYSRDDRPRRDDRQPGARKPWSREGGERSFGQGKRTGDNRYGNTYGDKRYGDKKRSSGAPRRDDRPNSYPRFDAPKPETAVRLNRFIANSGICSRREADDLITAGVVAVNGQIVTELGSKVNPGDEVRFNGEVIKGEKKVYIVMNKPKGYVTSLDDPHSDKTVMDLIKGACTERVYPVGRLDKNSVGVLLITNDGELTRKLTHPSYNKQKIYQVTLDKPLTQADMTKIAEGITLEDGEIHADEISYVAESRREIGIEIHSGRNRIVRRIFESLGYSVQKLDRVYFAGLTKKRLKRGGWRFLTPQEVGRLKSGEYE